MSILEQWGLALEDLLPHRGDMVLIDEVLEVDRISAVTRSVVKKGWPLADRDGVRSLILVELAAQTAGVCNGWDRIKSQGVNSDKTGYLVGIKRARFHVARVPFAVTVVARADNTYSFGNLREVSCTVHRQDTCLAEIILQVFQV